MDFLTFRDCQNITITGEGTVDGLGYEWWAREWSSGVERGRPNLLEFERVRNSTVTNLTWLNSPQRHLNLFDVDDITIQNMEIFVSMLKQKG